MRFNELTEQSQLDEFQLNPTGALASIIRWGAENPGVLAALGIAAGGGAFALTSGAAALGPLMAAVTSINAGQGALGLLSLDKLKDLIQQNPSQAEGYIKKLIYKYVGDQSDVEEFEKLHAQTAYKGETEFRWRAENWPVTMDKNAAESYLEKNDKYWLDTYNQPQGVAEGEQNVAEGSAHGYNVTRFYRKYRDQSKITRWLKKEAGLPKETKLYFDDADLVLGSDTIVPYALVDENLKFNDLLTALVKATGGTAKQKVDGVYRDQGMGESATAGVAEGGSDYEELQDKIQWLMGAPNYLKSDEARETAAYTPDTDSVWAGYRDDQLTKKNESVTEAKSLHKRVKIVKGPYAGKYGWIREIKHGAYKGAPKTYYVDVEGGDQANNLSSSELRLAKDQTVAEGPELKQAKRKYNQAAKDANIDQVGAGKKIDTMKKSLRQKDLGKEQALAEGANDMTPNWAKYVLDQIYNSNGDVTLTDLFDEGIPGLHDMFMATAEAHGLDPEEEFEDVQHELTVELEDIIKGGHDIEEGSRDAYQRDYDNSVAGMGKRQSYAYSQDGGANDEGWNNYKEPEPKRKIYSLQINGKTWTKDGNTVTFFTRERAESAKNSILNKRPETKIVVMVQEV